MLLIGVDVSLSMGRNVPDAASSIQLSTPSTSQTLLGLAVDLAAEIVRQATRNRTFEEVSVISYRQGETEIFKSVDDLKDVSAKNTPYGVGCPATLFERVEQMATVSTQKRLSDYRLVILTDATGLKASTPNPPCSLTTVVVGREADLLPTHRTILNRLNPTTRSLFFLERFNSNAVLAERIIEQNKRSHLCDLVIGGLPTARFSLFNRPPSDPVLCHSTSPVTFEVYGFVKHASLFNIPLAHVSTIKLGNGGDDSCGDKESADVLDLLKRSLLAESAAAVGRFFSTNSHRGSCEDAAPLTYLLFAAQRPGQSRAILQLGLIPPSSSLPPCYASPDEWRLLAQAGGDSNSMVEELHVKDWDAAPQSNVTSWHNPSSTALSMDVQKLLRAARRLPDKLLIFYQDLNRIRTHAISIGLVELLPRLGSLLVAEAATLSDESAKRQIMHTAELLKSPVDLARPVVDIPPLSAAAVISAASAPTQFR